MAPLIPADFSNVAIKDLNKAHNCIRQSVSPGCNAKTNLEKHVTVLSKKTASKLVKSERKSEITSHLLRLSIKDGEYTYAKADDIIMVESSNHLTVVYVAQQVGKVKRTIRNSCLKDLLVDLPESCFLRVNRFCAVNLKRLSGGSYHQQFFEFDFCITIKPKHPISHSIFNSIGK
jgi:DNA-binding LytR/AlgR family response regulator